MSETQVAGDQRPERAGPVGRALRIAVGVLLIVNVAGFYANGSVAFVIRTAAIGAALFAIYVVMHRFFLAHPAAGAARWLASVMALVPVVFAYVLGMSDGPIFGSGAGQVGALTFLAISLILAGVRGDRGCEVMALPNALFGRPCHLACIVFSPLDSVEKRRSARSGP